MPTHQSEQNRENPTHMKKKRRAGCDPRPIEAALNQLADDFPTQQEQKHRDADHSRRNAIAIDRRNHTRDVIVSFADASCRSERENKGAQLHAATERVAKSTPEGTNELFH